MEEDYTYLIIDDNSVDRMISQTMLQKYLDSPEVHEVSNSKDGIEWIKANHSQLKTPLIILLDMYMPGIDGFGFLELYHALDEEFKIDTSIFMLSSAQEDDQMTIINKYSSLSGILEKPINIDDLKAAILQ